MSSNVIPANNSKSSWGGLEVSQKALTFIPYHGYHINIYASECRNGDPIKYFGSPLVLLNPKSAKYSFNKIRERHQVSFDVDMWNQEIEDYVIEYLNELPNRPKTDKKHVQGIPFEEVILCSNVISSMYDLPSEWTPYQLDKKVTFTLYCPSAEKGKELAQLLKNDRDFQTQFASCFRVILSVTARESRQRDVRIKIENITSGKLCAELDQKFPNAKQVLLTAQDTKTILSESVNNVLVDSFSDMKEVADPAAKNRIYSTLQTMLVSSQEKINSDSGKTWDSVFWRDENTRPDKVAKTLNESYNKSDNETKEKMKNAFSDAMSSDMNASLNAEASARVLFLANANVKVKGQSQSNSSSRASSSSITDKDNYYREMKEIADKVEWNGEKFVPKSMNLTRINLSTLRNKQAFQDKEVVVSYSTAFLDLKMNVPEDGGYSSLSNTLSDPFSNIQLMKSDFIELQCQVEEMKANLLAAYKKIEVLESHLNRRKVYFHVKRTTDFQGPSAATVVPFEIAEANIGGAFDLGTGIFTAPRNGVYYFAFVGIRAGHSPTTIIFVNLVRNGVTVSGAHAKGSITSSVIPLTLHCTIPLKRGDAVYLENESNGTLWSNKNGYTHFTGFLIEDDLPQ